MGTSIKSALRRVASNDVVKAAALILLFTWFLFNRPTWSVMNDPDVWWHMRSGEWILQHHQLPHTDPFSLTGAGKPWVAYSWPFGVVIFQIARNWDLLGIVAFTYAAWLSIGLALFALIRSELKSFWWSVALTLPATGIILRNVAPRPGMITILFFLLTLNILLRARRGQTQWLWLLPVLIWIWANVHIQFIYGLFIIGVFAIEPLLNRIFRAQEVTTIPARKIWPVLLVCVVATVLNPYGLGPYRVIIDFLKEPKQIKFITEFHSMAFDVWMHYAVLLITLGAGVALGRMKKFEPLWIVLLVWAAVIGFRMERDIWVITFIALTVIAHSLAQTREPHKEDRRLWLGAALGVLVISVGMLHLQTNNAHLRSLVADQYPLGAVAYIHEHHLQGPIFNDFDWGGFLIYALPEFKVTIDGRTNIHGQDEIERSLRTWQVWPEWNTDPLLAQANLVIGSPKYALVNVLKLDPKWKLVFDDGVAVVFERVKQ
jgi:hypothetical protein